MPTLVSTSSEPTGSCVCTSSRCASEPAATATASRLPGAEAMEPRGCTSLTTGAMTVETRETINPPLIKTPGRPLARGFLIGIGAEPAQ